MDTKLSPAGEQVVIYDGSENEYDPHPMVAILARGRLAKIFDERQLNEHRGGFERYLASCEFQLTPSRTALAVVVSAGGDGAGSVFSVIAWRRGRYRVIFDPMVGQGRIELGVKELRLWSMIWGKARSGDGPGAMEYECVWCPHRYAITKYSWRDGRYIKVGFRRTARRYDPAEISGAPLVSK